MMILSHWQLMSKFTVIANFAESKLTTVKITSVINFQMELVFNWFYKKLKINNKYSIALLLNRLYRYSFYIL